MKQPKPLPARIALLILWALLIFIAYVLPLMCIGGDRFNHNN